MNQFYRTMCILWHKHSFLITFPHSRPITPPYILLKWFKSDLMSHTPPQSTTFKQYWSLMRNSGVKISRYPLPQRTERMVQHPITTFQEEEKLFRRKRMLLLLIRSVTLINCYGLLLFCPLPVYSMYITLTDSKISLYAILFPAYCQFCCRIGGLKLNKI